MGKGGEIMGFPLTGFYNPVEDPRANSTVFCEDVVSECIAQVFIQGSCAHPFITFAHKVTAQWQWQEVHEHFP